MFSNKMDDSTPAPHGRHPTDEYNNTTTLSSVCTPGALHVALNLGAQPSVWLLSERLSVQCENVRACFTVFHALSSLSRRGSFGFCLVQSTPGQHGMHPPGRLQLWEIHVR